VRVLHDPWLHKRGAQGRIGRFLPPMGVWMCQRLLEYSPASEKSTASGWVYLDTHDDVPRYSEEVLGRLQKSCPLSRM
jgi:hypothetical protein